MKSTVKLLIIAGLLIPAISSSCKKTEETKTPKDAQPNQIRSMLNFSLFKTTKTGTGTYEYGNVFIPKVDGKVTALSCLMPDIDIYSICLWDSSSQTVLASENINNNDTLYPNTKSITPVSIKSGKTYVITVKSVNKRWFEFRMLNNGSIPYPLSNQYINVTGYLWGSTTLAAEPKFPVNKSTSYISGLADFTFQPD